MLLLLLLSWLVFARLAHRSTRLLVKRRKDLLPMQLLRSCPVMFVFNCWLQ